MNKEYMTWKQFDEACYKLAEKLKSLKFKNIYGIPRGGLIVAVRLSHLLDIPVISDVKDISFFTILADDIADTGKTLDFLISEHASKGSCVATLYYHKQSRVVPDIWIHEKKDRWIVFPWEKRAKRPCRVCKKELEDHSIEELQECLEKLR